MTDAEFMNAEATMLTVSGRKIDLLRPRANLVDIKDIAHHLANICRFAGGVRFFYSDAEHSVLVSRLCPPRYAYRGLMHDASEAILNDVIRPLKRLPGMTFYRELEAEWERHLEKDFELGEMHPSVKEADDLACIVEKAILKDHGVCPPGLTLPGRAWWGRKTWSPRRARREFLERFNRLAPKHLRTYNRRYFTP